MCSNRVSAEFMVTSDREAKLLFTAGLGAERRQRHPQQPNALFDGKERLDQLIHDLFDGLLAL